MLILNFNKLLFSSKTATIQTNIIQQVAKNISRKSDLGEQNKLQLQESTVRKKSQKKVFIAILSRGQKLLNLKNQQKKSSIQRKEIQISVMKKFKS